jgi:pimeloyl-ACP methyl ester carboxylesterase
MTSENRTLHLTGVRGAELAWSESGHGPTAIWAHGLTSSGFGQEAAGVFDWSPLTARHRLVRYDARGHGGSSGAPEPEHYTWPNLGLDLLELLNQIAGDEQVDGLGSSMGTATLLYAVTTKPERFRRLVLTTPPTMGAERAVHVRGYLEDAALIERSGLAAYKEAFAAEPPPHVQSGLAQNPPAVEVTEPLLPSILRGAARSDLPADSALTALDLPVLILAWSGDSGHPLSTARHLADVIPGARLQIADTPMQLRTWAELAAEFLL